MAGRQRTSAEHGFTLIELMVVVLIIAILIAIAIPTFLGARKRAQDRAAQTALRTTITNAKAILSDTQDYTAATGAALATAEPSLAYVTAPGQKSTGPTVVSVDSDAFTFVAAVWSKSGKCYNIADRHTLSGGAGSEVPIGTSFWQKRDATGANCFGTGTPHNFNFTEGW